MKHDIFYTLRRQSPWLTVSGALMGIPFFIHAIYYLLYRSFIEVHLVELLVFMAVPMVIELLWCLMLHVFPLKSTTPLGVMCCMVFAVLLSHSLFYDNILRSVLSTVAILVVAQLVMLILCGRFPYKLFGSAALLIVLCGRVLLFTISGYLVRADWEGFLARELPDLCMLASMLCLFGAIEPHKREVDEE